MTLPLFGVYGASGCGRGVMPLARDQLAVRGISVERLVFVDDCAPSSSLNGHRVLSYEEFLELGAGSKYLVIAIANGLVRSSLADRCALDGIEPWTVKAANVVVMDEVQMGQGAVLSPFVTVTSNVRIGKHFHANLYSYVEHDCIIGDFVTFAPGAKCNGNVVIEDYAYIGSGAVIKQGKPGQPLIIGRGAVIGMGAVVTRHVPPGVTVVGNPARLI
jgi:sugar O-acyltransferase (sialic acid O-acetyltransferase NeuD family)